MSARWVGSPYPVELFKRNLTRRVIAAPSVLPNLLPPPLVLA